MIDKEKVLAFVKEKGPVLPRDLTKQFGADTFIMGAHLSTMVDEKQLRISYAKIGGSPVYYSSGQEEKLSILFQYLPSKEKEAYSLLKDMKLIKDSTAQPAIRVALRNIKDFAKPIEVNLGESREIFWKWYLFSNNDAEKAIREFFLPKSDNNDQFKDKITLDLQSSVKKETTEQKGQETKENQPEKEQEQKQKTTQSIEMVPEKNETQPQHKEENREQIKKPEPDQKKLIQETQAQQEQKQKKPEPDHLLQKLEKMFLEKKIEILETQVIKKNTEIELVVLVPSQIGKLRFFCKARDKKKTNDKDMSSLFVQAQMKKLPALYITTGEIAKKAKEMVEQEFKTITLVQI